MSARVGGAVLPKPTKAPRRPMSSTLEERGSLNLTSPMSRVRALPSPRPETSGRSVVVRVAEVVLRLHLDQRAPHALHYEHKLPQHGVVALVVAGAPDVARRIAHRILNAAAARRACGLARG